MMCSIRELLGAVGLMGLLQPFIYDQYIYMEKPYHFCWYRNIGNVPGIKNPMQRHPVKTRNLNHPGMSSRRGSKFSMADLTVLPSIILLILGTLVMSMTTRAIFFCINVHTYFHRSQLTKKNS